MTVRTVTLAAEHRERDNYRGDVKSDPRDLLAGTSLRPTVAEQAAIDAAAFWTSEPTWGDDEQPIEPSYAVRAESRRVPVGTAGGAEGGIGVRVDHYRDVALLAIDVAAHIRELGELPEGQPIGTHTRPTLTAWDYTSRPRWEGPATVADTRLPMDLTPMQLEATAIGTGSHAWADDQQNRDILGRAYGPRPSDLVMWAQLSDGRYIAPRGEVHRVLALAIDEFHSAQSLAAGYHPTERRGVHVGPSTYVERMMTTAKARPLTEPRPMFGPTRADYREMIESAHCAIGVTRGQLNTLPYSLAAFVMRAEFVGAMDHQRSRQTPKAAGTAPDGCEDSTNVHAVPPRQDAIGSGARTLARDDVMAESLSDYVAKAIALDIERDAHRPWTITSARDAAKVVKAPRGIVKAAAMQRGATFGLADVAETRKAKNAERNALKRLANLSGHFDHEAKPNIQQWRRNEQNLAAGRCSNPSVTSATVRVLRDVFASR